MIIDYISRLQRYNRLFHCEDLLNNIGSMNTYPSGRYEFGQGYAMIQEGCTASADDVRFEAHEKYIDLQIMLDGFEILV